MASPFRDIVKKQIGRPPKGDFKVVKICRFGFPQVIENPPLVEGKPFPTLFWLTCPHLVREISRLEERGFIELYEEKLKRNHPFRNSYLKAHSFERMLRKVKLPRNIPKNLKLKLLNGGIGGIEKPLGVKCLHLHTASYLGGVPNPVGREVLMTVGATECRDNYCLLRLFNKK